MASGSLRRFDVQARISVILSGVAALSMVGLAVMLFRNFNRQLMVIAYGAKSVYEPVVYGLTAVTVLLAAVAVVLGFNSAGQRRNEQQGQSWAGFFIGSAVLSLSIVLFAMFYMYRLKLK